MNSEPPMKPAGRGIRERPPPGQQKGTPKGAFACEVAERTTAIGVYRLGHIL